MVLDPKLAAKLDQCVAESAELLPSLWWQLYEGCQKQGFTDGQAMDLVKTYILAMVRNQGGT